MGRHVLHLAYTTFKTSSQENVVSVAAFEAAKFVWPQKMMEIQLNAEDIDALQVFPFLRGLVLASLTQELPTYLAKAADLHKDADPIFYSENFSNYRNSQTVWPIDGFNDGVPLYLRDVLKDGLARHNLVLYLVHNGIS